MFVALLGAISFGAFSAYQNITMSDEEKFLLANIEALTQTEGTAVGYCNERDSNVPKDKREWFYECNIFTSSSTIYPCPQSQSFSGKAKQDRCTK